MSTAPYTVQVRPGRSWQSDLTSRRLDRVRERMLDLTRSPRTRAAVVFVRVVDRDGRTVQP